MENKKPWEGQNKRAAAIYLLSAWACCWLFQNLGLCSEIRFFFFLCYWTITYQSKDQKVTQTAGSMLALFTKQKTPRLLRKMSRKLPLRGCLVRPRLLFGTWHERLGKKKMFSVTYDSSPPLHLTFTFFNFCSFKGWDSGQIKRCVSVCVCQAPSAGV